MVSALPPEVVMKLQEKLGKEEALEFIKALDEAVRELTVQRKLELKDELAKELVTKADLREAMAKIWEEMAKLRGEVARLEGQIFEVKGEVAEVRNEVAGVKGEVAELRGEIGEIRGEIAEVKAELRRLESYMKIITLLFLVAIALYSPVFFELVKMFIIQNH